jgi:hypothetical protein
MFNENDEVEMWKVLSGPCKVDSAGCVVSGNYPSNYDAEEQCEIAVNEDKMTPLHVVAFATEQDFDVLRINGHDYSGARGPQGVIPTGTIYWGADSDVQSTGWKLCTRDGTPKPNPEKSGIRIMKVVLPVLFILMACCCSSIIFLGWRVRKYQIASTREERSTLQGQTVETINDDADF